MCSSLPSPSSIRQERFAFLFRMKDSVKLRSDEPPSQADGRASLSIFPPHVTLRFGTLKTGQESYDYDNEEKAALLLQLHAVSHLPFEQELGLSW